MPKRWLSFFVAFIVASTLSLAQVPVIKHKEKVIIEPPVAGQTDGALTVVGGITAGTTPTVIVNADGTLNASATLTDGSVNIIKLAVSGCVTGEIVKYDGAQWNCGADSGGGGGTASIADGTEASPGFQFTSDTDTGVWRPGANLFAVSTGGIERVRIDASGNMAIGKPAAVNNTLHLYRGTSQVGIRLERSDSGNQWDINANTDLTIGENGSNTNLSLTPDGYVGINDTTPTYFLDVNGTGRFVGNVTFDSEVVGSLIPATADQYDLGSNAKPWERLFAGEIKAEIFGLTTTQLYNGRLIVGKQAGELAAAVSSAATTIDFGQAIDNLPSWVLIRAVDAGGTIKTEYIKVVSLSSGTTYNVIRDEATSHVTDPAWSISTAYLTLGGSGDGRVEIDSTTGFPFIGMTLQSTAYNTATELIRLGNLNGMSTMSSYPNRFGIFIGDSTGYLKYHKALPGTSPTSGVDSTLIVKGNILADSGQFGTPGTNYINVEAAGLNVNTGAIWGGKTSYADTAAGFWLGQDAGVYKFSVGGGTITGATVQTSTNCGSGSTACTKLTTTALVGYDASNVLSFTLNGSGLEMPDNSSTTFTDKNYIRWYANANRYTSIGGSASKTYLVQRSNETLTSGGVGAPEIRIDGSHSGYAGSGYFLYAGVADNAGNAESYMSLTAQDMLFIGSQYRAGASFTPNVIPNQVYVSAASSIYFGATSGSTSWRFNTSTNATTLPGDLTVDTSTLVVDATYNRVGIGTASPSAKLAIASGDIVIDSNQALYLNGASGGSVDTNWLFYKDTTNHNITVGGSGSGARHFRVVDTGASWAERFKVNFLTGLTTIQVPAASTMTQGLFLVNQYSATNSWGGTSLSFGYASGEANYSSRILGYSNAGTTYASRLYFQTHSGTINAWNPYTWIDEGGTLRVNGPDGYSGNIALYGNYSGSPASPGIVINDYNGTSTWSVNGNGGATTQTGNATAPGFQITSPANVGNTSACLTGGANSYIGTCTSAITTTVTIGACVMTFTSGLLTGKTGGC